MAALHSVDQLLIDTGLLGPSIAGLAALVAVDTIRRTRHRNTHPDEDRAHDPVTGLLSRQHLAADATALLQRSTRRRTTVVCLLIDLDNFKGINDSLGHHAGDQVLAATARRLQACSAPEDVVVRLGGDEFVILAARADAAAARRFVEEVHAALEDPIRVDDLDLAVRASIGTALRESISQTHEDLVRIADDAMYRAKTQASGHWQPADTRRGDRPQHDAEAVQWLTAGLDDDQFLLHYQPQIDCRTGAVTGFEAMLRWRHPTRGLLPPSEFLPLAERCGLTARINSFVLGRLLRDHADLTAIAPGARCAVNMTARSLLGVDFVRDLERRLGDAGVPGSDLVLEITESATHHGRQAAELFAGLHRLGCTVSVQEFGAAAASLTSLWQNPAMGEIKIHPTIVRAVTEDIQAERLVRALVNAAHGLSMRVVAEGVEHTPEARMLRSLGCDVLQGFWIGPAVDLDGLREWAHHWERVGARTAREMSAPTSSGSLPDPARGVQPPPVGADTPDEQHDPAGGPR